MGVRASRIRVGFRVQGFGVYGLEFRVVSTATWEVGRNYETSQTRKRILAWVLPTSTRPRAFDISEFGMDKRGLGMVFVHWGVGSGSGLLGLKALGGV